MPKKHWQSKVITVRMPEPLFNALHEKATAKEMSLNGLCLKTLVDSVDLDEHTLSQIYNSQRLNTNAKATTALKSKESHIEVYFVPKEEKGNTDTEVS